MSNEEKAVPEGRFAPEDWEYILLQMVNDRSGVDFSMYRMPTFRRRYLKRINSVCADDLRSYVKLLEEDTEQLDLLVTDLLIGVTSFFRDRAAFRVLDESVIGPLFSREDNANVRCWVAGCSTGMEAYSIAMLMQKAMERNGGGYTIFSTDISRTALSKASKGIYTAKQFETVPDEYREYFAEMDRGWRISRDIRSHMVFSHHDVLADPPFAHMDLVSCRNMMIYLKPRAQDIVLGRLNYSLSVGGYLFLGSGETPGTRQENLETVDSRWRVFKKSSETVISVDMFPFEKNTPDSIQGFGRTGYAIEDEDEISARIRTFTSCLEERFFPDCVFIDEDYRILFINGDMNSYLSIPSGVPGGSLLPMLSPAMKSAVRAGVRRARGSFRKIECDTPEDVTISVSCVSPLEMNGVFLLEFNRKDPEAENTARIACSESDITVLEEQIALLESDLATTRRELRSRTGELQASNEELQTTNEEIRSANEELTASNEELMASNEELQRLNRRLTVLTDDMRNLLESMDVGSLFLDRELRIRRFNPRVSRFFKITEADTGRSITDFTTSIEQASFDALASVARKVSDSGEAVELSLDADVSGDWLAKISPYRTSSGTVEGSVITFVDVTALRDRERSLADSERKFRGLFNGLPIGALLIYHSRGSDEFSVLDMNPAFQGIKERVPDILTLAPFREGVLGEEPAFDFATAGMDCHCRVFRPVDFAETLCVTVRDVTETSRAEERRRGLEKRLHDAQILAGMGIWEYDGTDSTVTLSPEAASLFGMSTGTPIPLEEFSEGIEEFQVFHTAVRAAMEAGDTYAGTISSRPQNGESRRFFRVSCYPSDHRGGRGLYGYALEITGEVEGKRTLIAAHDRLEETQGMARIGVIEQHWSTDFSSHRETFHDSAVRVLKLSECHQEDFFSRHLDEDLSQSLLRRLRNCARTGEEFVLDMPARNGMGENVFIQLTARRKEFGNGDCTVNIVIMDVTRRHQLETELKHSEKLRSVGELAGGIAHDFNNQLMGIVGFAECLRSERNTPEEVEFIRGILSSSERAGALVRQLLAFSRKGLSHIAPFDLHHLIDEVIALLERSIDRRIEIRRDYRALDPVILGDASEMNNAVLNLALNARDAMDGEGTMTFSTSDEQPGSVVFRLSDTGKGMPPEVAAKAFEPFFTTKSLGNGTGMGLPAVYGTVSAHNGTVSIQSAPGDGTTVTVILPLSDAPADNGLKSAPSADSPMEGTILVVDDEEVVRTVLSKLVRSLGFEVLKASDGIEAVEMFQNHADEIRLVLMDMTMPRMNGMDAFMRMREVDPAVSVIIISGHSAESTSGEMLRLGISRVLQKPVSLSALSDAIRECIPVSGSAD
ncbi:MAG TPA: CheR family methyltransferase [Candidatus Sabulitectum sp.]|nr:CheR family methyltransferase [Candidatus Sabulitectum sp.]